MLFYDHMGSQINILPMGGQQVQINFLILLNLKCRARYGVQLEKGPFDKRTADFLWMMIFGAVSLLVSC